MLRSRLRQELLRWRAEQLPPGQYELVESENVKSALEGVVGTTLTLG